MKAKITTALDKIAKVDGISGVTSPYSPEGAAKNSQYSKGQIGFATVNWSDPISIDKVETQVDPVLKVINEARRRCRPRHPGRRQSIRHGRRCNSNTSEKSVGVTAAMVVLFIMFRTFLAMGMPTSPRCSQSERHRH